MKNWQCQWLDTSTISIQWALGAGILQRWTYKAIGMWRNGNASVWSLLKYHFSELWWPEFWNHKAIEIQRIANVKTPLKYYSRGLRWTEFWNHKVIGMLRIGNASVWTPLKCHSSGLWPPYPTGMIFQWGPSVDRFDRQSSMPYFLYENYGSFPVGYRQLPDVGSAVADTRGNPPTKGQRVS